jgi:hypothetical protein
MPVACVPPVRTSLGSCLPMDEKEAARRAAEHKAAALHHLGYEEGAGATIWARAVRDNLALHEEARARIPTPRGERGEPLETWR